MFFFFYPAKPTHRSRFTGGSQGKPTTFAQLARNSTESILS